MLLRKKVPDLIGGVETNWFDLPYCNDPRVLYPRIPGHQLRNFFGDRTGDIRIPRGLNGDNHSCRQSPLLQCPRAFEEKVVLTKVLHENNVARSNLVRTNKALTYRRDPELAA